MTDINERFPGGDRVFWRLTLFLFARLTAAGQVIELPYVQGKNKRSAPHRASDTVKDRTLLMKPPPLDCELLDML